MDDVRIWIGDDPPDGWVGVQAGAECPHTGATRMVATGLERVPHQEASARVNQWASCLAPGGHLAVAAPDLGYCAAAYQRGDALDLQAILMGQAGTEHRSLWDEDVLHELLVNAGLERVGAWSPAAEFPLPALQHPWVVGAQAFKPSGSQQLTGVMGILSAPRFGPVMHYACAQRALGALRIPCTIMGGAYWHATLCELMEKCLADGARYILTMDYDTVFSHQDVQELYRLAEGYADADAVCALQQKRNDTNVLLTMRDKHGNLRREIPMQEFARNLTRVNSGHFGLTLIKASALSKLPRPWMIGRANLSGTWGDGHLDPDMEFWERWNTAGFRLYVANRVVVGHLQETVVWPGRDLKPVYQNETNYMAEGIPAEVVR